MGKIVHSSIDENSSARGGKAGDQTGKEVYVRNWYYSNWSCVVRYKDIKKAKKAAAIGVKLANSNLVGYDQGQRNTLYAALKKNKWDVDKYIKSKEKTECDCASFIYACYCCVLPFLRSDGNAPVTSSIPTVFSKKKGFTTYRDKKFLISDKYLHIGDIVDRESGHVVMYIDSEKALKSTDTSSNSDDDDESGTVTTPTDSNVDRNASILREVGYLSSKLQPSIQASDVRLSLINTTYCVKKSSSSSSSKDGTTYNINKLTSKQKTVVNFLTGKGLNLAGAIGILANIEHESPGVNTAAIGDHGTSFGICQWHNDRGSAMKKYVGSNWKTTLTGQLKYLWSELTTSYKSTLSYIKKVDDTLSGCKKAADKFVREFEIPANVNNESKKRQATAEKLWKQCSISKSTTSSKSSNSNVNDLSGGPNKTVKIPSKVKQSGLIPNYTNYSYWLTRWRYTQKKVANLWKKAGKPHEGHIATLSGYYLVAVATVFGSVGDIIKVNLEGGKSFNCIIADSKGSDATNPYGHVLNGKVDIIEWEMKGSSSSASDSKTQQKMKLPGKGKKVKSIENYGKYWGLD